MKLLQSHKVITVDCDDTLCMWDKSDYPDFPTVQIDFKGNTSNLCINYKNVNLVRKLGKLGYSIVIWSQSGFDWAEAVAKAVGLWDMVSLCMTKPQYYVDDLPSSFWMGKRLWRHPITGESQED